MKVAIITARMASSRLPGKIMLDLCGAPMLERMVERVRCAKLLDDIVIATTDKCSDDVVEALCQTIDCKCFRGDEHDVLSRVQGAANWVDASQIIHLTGDCPFVDGELIDDTIKFFNAGQYDFAGNNLAGTLPIGLDVRMFSKQALHDVARRTNDPIDRVHVTYYMYTHPEIYNIGSLDNYIPTKIPMRLTVDEFLDYKLAQILYEEFMVEMPNVSYKKFLKFLTKFPEITQINLNVRQKKPAEG